MGDPLALGHAFTPPQGRQPADAAADFASSLYRTAAPAADTLRSTPAELAALERAAADAAAPPRPNQVAELSEARRRYEELQATAQKAKEAALRLKEGLAREHQRAFKRNEAKGVGSGPEDVKAALDARLSALGQPKPAPKRGEVHEHTRDDGTKQKRYLVASRKEAPLDAKVLELRKQLRARNRQIQRDEKQAEILEVKAERASASAAASTAESRAEVHRSTAEIHREMHRDRKAAPPSAQELEISEIARRAHPNPDP